MDSQTEKVKLLQQVVEMVRFARRKGSPELAKFAADLEIELSAKLRDMEGLFVANGHNKKEAA